MNRLGIKEIEAIIPHRHPFLLVDYIEDFEPGVFATGSKEENKGKIALFGGIDKCRFKGQVQPGDKLKLETRIIKEKGPVGVGEAIASVDGKMVAKAEVTFMIVA